MGQCKTKTISRNEETVTPGKQNNMADQKPSGCNPSTNESNKVQKKIKILEYSDRHISNIHESNLPQYQQKLISGIHQSGSPQYQQKHISGIHQSGSPQYKAKFMSGIWESSRTQNSERMITEGMKPIKTKMTVSEPIQIVSRPLKISVDKDSNLQKSLYPSVPSRVRPDPSTISDIPFYKQIIPETKQATSEISQEPSISKSYNPEPNKLKPSENTKIMKSSIGLNNRKQKKNKQPKSSLKSNDNDLKKITPQQDNRSEDNNEKQQTVSLAKSVKMVSETRASQQNRKVPQSQIKKQSSFQSLRISENPISLLSYELNQ